MTNKKYNIHVSSRYYVWNEKDEVFDWAVEAYPEDKLVESYDTLKECFESMENWGSSWVLYPSVYIETEEDGEVWESTAQHTKCDKCGHEEWENITTSTGMPYKEFEVKVAAGL